MANRTDLDLELEERRRVLDAWAAKRRQIAALEAEATELLIEQIALYDADVSESPYHRDAIYRSMIAEFSAVARLPKGTMEYAFSDARALQKSLPSVREAFSAGRISAGHVREIVRASAVVAEAICNRRVDAAVMALYEAAVLVFAEEETAARTRAHALQVAAALAGETLDDRHQRAEKERCVSVRSLDDGLALLTAVLPEWVAVAIMDRITRMARHIADTRDDRDPPLDFDLLDDGENPIYAEDIALESPLHDAIEQPVARAGSAGSGAASGHGPGADPTIFGNDGGTFALDPDVEHVLGDTRTSEQVRADVFADMLLTAVPGAVHGDGLDSIQARIQVTVAATTLIGQDERPAELDGHGPLHPDIARDLAGRNTGWSRLFLDPTGMITETDTYTPTEGMRRFLRARDQRCRFPGCRMPVHRCDVDHNHDHAKGGRTCIDNLGHLCRSHHSLKHPDIPDGYRWTASQRPGGDITWFSPLGYHHTDHPPRRVMFV